MSAPKFAGFSDDILKTSAQWQRETCPDTTILDPDGWDRTNYQFSFFEEQITYKQFLNRLILSTCIRNATDV